MRDPIPIFVDLARVRQIDEDAFEAICHSMGYNINNLSDDEVQSISEKIKYEIVRYDDIIIMKRYIGYYIWNIKLMREEDEEKYEKIISSIPWS